MPGSLGIFVNLPHIQSEGIETVLDNLERAGATALCISPKAGTPSENGVRFPPLHGDGVQRAFARPVWGKGDLRVEFDLTYTPDVSLYRNTSYSPPTSAAPPEDDLTARVIEAAHARGMKVHLLIQPLVVPGLRREDAPLRPDGSSMYGHTVSPIGCPNRADVRAYGLAALADLARHYADVDGLFLDWAEYGAYRIEDFFTCCCPACAAAAHTQGFDWESMQRDNRAFWDYLHQLYVPELREAAALDFLTLGERFPGWGELQRFKARTITSFYADARRTLDDLGAQSMGVSARGWCAPWNTISGMDYAALGDVCAAITPKLFLFDYAAIPRWYAETLLAWNPALPVEAVVEAVLHWFDLPDVRPTRTLDQYIIPPPDEPHPFDFSAYERRIEQMLTGADGKAAVYPFAHAYLPLDQWHDMIGRVNRSGVGGMWIQSYGYLSDAALDVLAQTWARPPKP